MDKWLLWRRLLNFPRGGRYYRCCAALAEDGMVVVDERLILRWGATSPSTNICACAIMLNVCSYIEL